MPLKSWLKDLTVRLNRSIVHLMNNPAPLHLFQTALTALFNSARQHNVDLTVAATLAFLVPTAEANAQNHMLPLASVTLNRWL